MVSDAARRRVLVYTLMPTQWRTMHQVARALKASARFEPVVFFDRNAANTPFERDVRACLADGIECHDERGQISEARVAAVVAAPPSPRPFAVRALHAALGGRRAVWHGLVEPIAAFPEQYTHYRARIAFARRFLRRGRIQLVVLPGDSVSYDTPAWIAAAHESGTRAVIVPFSTNTPAGVAADLSLSPENDATRWFNRPVAWLAPRWVYREGARPLVRESAGKILALHALALAPPLPWVLHSGAADVVVADSERARDSFAAEGLPRDRIEVVGALGNDVLAHVLSDAPARRAALYRELGLPPARPMILGSICDYVRYFTLGGAQEGFRSSAELIEFWVRTMTEVPGHNVVLSLHPWLRYEDMRHLEHFGARIARRPIEELVPLCELFVVSTSVTTRLAIACGKPVVDHDVLHFRLGDYADAGGVIVVETADDFRDAVHGLATDRLRFAAAARAQAVAAPRFGNLDGRAGERLLALFERLSAPATRRARAPAGPRSGSPSTAG